MLGRAATQQNVSRSARIISNVQNCSTAWLGRRVAGVIFATVLSATAFGQNVPTNSEASRILAGPIVEKVTENSAELFWIADNESPATVRYGESRDGMTNAAQVTAVPSEAEKDGHHAWRAELNGLRPDQSYYYSISTLDGRVNRRGDFLTEPANFRKQNRPWITQGPVIEFLDAENAVIAWSTNTKSSTLVRYNTDPNALIKTTTAPWGQETHRVFLHGLRPGTKYYFVVESGQAQGTGTMAKSNMAQFTTVNRGEAALRNAAEPTKPQAR